MKSRLTFAAAGLLLLVASDVRSQDPELLMNEARYAARYHTFSDTRDNIQSAGPSAGATVSILNLFFSNFNTKRYRIGDIIGADLVPIGYTNSAVPPVPVWIWGRTELGLQGYYAVSKEFDIGLKVYNQLDADWDVAWSHIIFQVVARYRSLILETSTGTEGPSDSKHYQGSLKFILGNEDRYSGIFGRYEYQEIKSAEPYLAKHWSVGYFVHFASHRE